MLSGCYVCLGWTVKDALRCPLPMLCNMKQQLLIHGQGVPSDQSFSLIAGFDCQSPRMKLGIQKAEVRKNLRLLQLGSKIDFAPYCSAQGWTRHIQTSKRFEQVMTDTVLFQAFINVCAIQLSGHVESRKYFYELRGSYQL